MDSSAGLPEWHDRKYSLYCLLRPATIANIFMIILLTNCGAIKKVIVVKSPNPTSRYSPLSSCPPHCLTFLKGAKLSSGDVATVELISTAVDSLSIVGSRPSVCPPSPTYSLSALLPSMMVFLFYSSVARELVSSDNMECHFTIHFRLSLVEPSRHFSLSLPCLEV